MSKYRITGMLAGDKIDIRCTKNQAVVIRNRLADWLDEYPNRDKIKKDKIKSDKERIEEIHDKRFLTGIDFHRGGYDGPNMRRGGR